MNALLQWISCLKVASNFLFRLSVRHVGRMNTQVRLLNSLVRLAGWVGTLNSLVRCVTRSGWCSIQYTMSKCLLNCITCYLFPLLARIAEWLKLKIVSAATWISLSIKFLVLLRQWKRNPGQTSPRHATGIPRNKSFSFNYMHIFYKWGEPREFWAT